MPEFVTLSCPSCGAKLQVTAEIDRFACSYCGQEHVVRRSGGIITLAPVVAALNQVRSGVDRTAAELAIVRVQKEIVELTGQRDQYLRANPRPEPRLYQNILIMIGVAVVILSIVLFSSKVTTCAGIFLVIGIFIFAAGLIPVIERPAAQRDWDHVAGEKLKAFAAEISKKEEELRQARDLVSGSETNG